VPPTSKKNFSGYLILVVGKSGSGKDSIIKGSIEAIMKIKDNYHTPKRYITRPSSESEDNMHVNPSEFNRLSREGKFALEWHIYGLSYGIPIEIDNYLKKGIHVIVNVSRTIIDEAKRMYYNVKVAFIKVPFEIILKRVTERNRERDYMLEERLNRARENESLSNVDIIIDNSGELDSAIDQFITFLLSLE
jgi:ribose 1,5-bisphosphokinase